MTALSRRLVLGGAAAAAAIGGLPLAGGTAQAGPRALREGLDYAVRKLRAVAPGISRFPEETKFEKWIYTDSGGWVGGFWPGLLWLAHLETKDPLFRRLAEESAERLAPRRTDLGTHDLGFLFYPSWVTAYRVTGEREWRDGAIQASDSLIRRYNTKGRFIRAWGNINDPGNAGRVIIDTMMNLDLLFFASKETGDAKYSTIAVEHARTTAKYFLRPDGSTPHVYDFDPATGTPIGPNTVQGYSPTSCWSRGQAWGMYGFTTVYRRTGQREFLDVATKLADHVLPYLRIDPVPIWDYRSPYAPHDIRDSSAGAITACALLDLAKITGNNRYRETAVSVLNAITDTCLTTKSSRAEAIVGRGTRHRGAEGGIEVSLPYGDYYYVEALLRLFRPAELAAAIGL
ncbi:glycoside hydrolase family protein [Allokutzneria albata]|uniref:Unsaturated chondroitin disaccharide hydrolase n=1 Tax=Allokutzneria albata TaxID=211114 RepID=A0A1H0ALH4_ALLAB|nr:glycoside hydrolase family 88 protein [Allokutzneria albata]SDN33696.1 unsaturated chondroitin disaccharide hydrolase [Allokutzneria albata]